MGKFGVAWRILVGIAFIAVIGLSVYNLCKNSNFLQASAASCMTLLIALGVTFYLSNKMGLKRKQKELYLDLLNGFHLEVAREENYSISEAVDREVLLMKTRKLNNMLDILKQFSSKFGIQTEIGFVCEKFFEYEELIGNHITDPSYLNKSYKELKRPIELIESKLFEAKLKIFEML